MQRHRPAVQQTHNGMHALTPYALVAAAVAVADAGLPTAPFGCDLLRQSPIDLHKSAVTKFRSKQEKHVTSQGDGWRNSGRLTDGRRKDQVGLLLAC